MLHHDVPQLSASSTDCSAGELLFAASVILRYISYGQSPLLIKSRCNNSSGVTSHRQPRQCRGPKTVKGTQSDPNYVSRLLLDCVANVCWGPKNYSYATEQFIIICESTNLSAYILFSELDLRVRARNCNFVNVFVEQNVDVRNDMPSTLDLIFPNCVLQVH